MCTNLPLLLRGPTDDGDVLIQYTHTRIAQFVLSAQSTHHIYVIQYHIVDSPSSLHTVYSICVFIFSEALHYTIRNLWKKKTKCVDTFWFFQVVPCDDTNRLYEGILAKQNFLNFCVKICRTAASNGQKLSTEIYAEYLATQVQQNNNFRNYFSDL